MSLQKNETTTRQEQEQHIEDENNPWTLERVMTTSRTESLSASIATNMTIWPKNTGRRKKRNQKVFQM